MNLIRRPFRFRYYNLTLFLIGINILVFIAQQMFSSPYPSQDLTTKLGLSVWGIFNGYVWQFVTYMFSHGGFSHILFNMLALFIFGTALERHMGSWEFLCYYLTTGILAGVFSFFVYWVTGQNVLLIGASGAIFAIQLAYATFFPNQVLLIWGIIPVRASVLVLIFTGVEVFSIILDKTGVSRGGGNVAHLTHLAGFAFGWIYFLVRFGFNPWNSLFRRR